jgi:hypothetical protein
MGQLTVLNRLASALGRRDEAPNQKLAKEIAASSDKKAAKELVENLSNKDKNIQSDCIKVLYEIGERNPELISEYYDHFGRLLQSKNNRLAWGAMTALDTIAEVNPEGVYALLPRIVAVADSGSVIARDHAVGILVKLAGRREYSNGCFPLLLGQLKKSPNNQFPMYVERSFEIMNESMKEDFAKILTERLGGLEKESQRKRVEKVLRELR